MATYNGEKYLDQQLNSIQTQNYKNWHLIIRDDQSTDKTPSIIKSFKEKNPENVTIINDSLGNLGCTKNFFELMRASNSDYVSFADQDDIWDNKKLDLSVQALHEAEIETTPEKPMLVYHDFSIIDENGQEKCKSHHKEKENNPIRRLLKNNVRMPFFGNVWGFSMTANRALIQNALPVPEVTAGHDTHLAYLAHITGNINFLNIPLAQYRRHTNNASEIKSYAKRSISELFSIQSLAKTTPQKHIKSIWDRAQNNLNRKAEISGAFLEHYKDKIPKEEQKLLHDFQNISNMPTLKRKELIFKYCGGTPSTRILASLVL